jgi:hypothetical protein
MEHVKRQSDLACRCGAQTRYMSQMVCGDAVPVICGPASISMLLSVVMRYSQFRRLRRGQWQRRMGLTDLGSYVDVLCFTSRTRGQSYSDKR